MMITIATDRWKMVAVWRPSLEVCLYGGREGEFGVCSFVLHDREMDDQ